MMTDTEKFQHLLKVLKNYAEQPTCYNLNPDYEYPHHSWDIFEDGSDYGEIMFARPRKLDKNDTIIDLVKSIMALQALDKLYQENNNGMEQLSND